MNRLAGLVIAALVLMVQVTPSWGEPPPNPTASDFMGNTAGGTGALESIPDDNQHRYNTAFGFNALSSNTWGLANTAIGHGALSNNTSGSSNIASGFGSLFNNTTGNLNTATGDGALGLNTAGSENTASGVGALKRNTTGNFNTATGSRALEHNRTGKENIAVGAGAGAALATGNRNIYLGHPGAASESKTMRLGSVQTKTFIAGVSTTPVSGTNVTIDANGQLGTLLSSARYKRDIDPMGARSEGVLKLRPVTFVYKQDEQGVRQYGLIAEEVAAVYPELVTRTATGEVQGVRYQELIPLLVNELPAAATRNRAPAAGAGGAAERRGADARRRRAAVEALPRVPPKGARESLVRARGGSSVPSPCLVGCLEENLSHNYPQLLWAVRGYSVGHAARLKYFNY